IAPTYPQRQYQTDTFHSSPAVQLFTQTPHNLSAFGNSMTHLSEDTIPAAGTPLGDAHRLMASTRRRLEMAMRGRSVPAGSNTSPAIGVLETGNTQAQGEAMVAATSIRRRRPGTPTRSRVLTMTGPGPTAMSD